MNTFIMAYEAAYIKFPGYLFLTLLLFLLQVTTDFPLHF